jgi:hypothetical protein
MKTNKQTKETDFEKEQAKITKEYDKQFYDKKEETIKLLHYFIFKDHEMRYLCNQACSVTEGKMTNDFFEVTCRNCHKLLVRDLKDKYYQQGRKDAIDEEIKFLDYVECQLISAGDRVDTAWLKQEINCRKDKIAKEMKE